MAYRTWNPLEEVSLKMSEAETTAIPKYVSEKVRRASRGDGAVSVILSGCLPRRGIRRT